MHHTHDHDADRSHREGTLGLHRRLGGRNGHTQGTDLGSVSSGRFAVTHVVDTSLSSSMASGQGIADVPGTGGCQPTPRPRPAETLLGLRAAAPNC